MRAMAGGALLLWLAASCGIARAELDQARAEPNLEKRSKLAIDNAAAALRAARDAYRAGNSAETSSKVREVEESVELAYMALTDTGKNPRKSPKYFKQAEMATRELGRKLEDFQHEMGYTDRASLDPVKAKVQQVHDDLLTGLMEGRKKK